MKPYAPEHILHHLVFVNHASRRAGQQFLVGLLRNGSCSMKLPGAHFWRESPARFDSGARRMCHPGSVVKEMPRLHGLRKVGKACHPCA
jgi:hypothetical protein